MPYCTDCGFEIPPGTRFCPSCGSDQITVPTYEIKKSPSVLPLILGILGISLRLLHYSAHRSDTGGPRSCPGTYG